MCLLCHAINNFMNNSRWYQLLICISNECDIYDTTEIKCLQLIAVYLMCKWILGDFVNDIYSFFKTRAKDKDFTFICEP